MNVSPSMNDYSYLEVIQSLRNIYHPNQQNMDSRFSGLMMQQVDILFKFNFILENHHAVPDRLMLVREQFWIWFLLKEVLEGMGLPTTFLPHKSVKHLGHDASWKSSKK